MLKVTSPLIIPIQEFKTFDEYFLSLSKKCRNSLTLPKQKRLMDGLKYRQLGWNENYIREFMDLWEKQSIHFGTPRWPDGWFDFMKDLHSRETFDMFGMEKDNQIISVHFIFKFNDYIYCNSPLYDKEEYDKISLGRLMWYNLIRFSIEENYCNYMDLEGNNNGDTYREVILNKVPPGTPGDFGYKWFFIPEKIKELDPQYYHYYDFQTIVENGWKGLRKEYPLRAKTLYPWVNGNENIRKYIDRKYKNPKIKAYTSVISVDDGDVVVDIGGGEGDFVRTISDKASKVYLIEPNIKTDYISDNVEIIKRAISVSEVSDDIVDKDLNLVNYPSSTLKTILENNDIENIDFLKINCTGAEWYLFGSDDMNFVKWMVLNVKKASIVFNNVGMDSRKLKYTFTKMLPGGEIWESERYTITNEPGNWEVFKDVHFDYFRDNGFEVTTTDLNGEVISDLENINDCIVHLEKNTKKKHHFYIRYFKRERELRLLLDQLKSVGIRDDQITLVTTWKKLNLPYEIHECYNSGYQQGDADLIQKSVELSDPTKLNHYLNAGVLMYNKRHFKKYLKMVENSNHILHIARGNDMVRDNRFNPIIGCENQEELATGMIISATKSGVDVLKNCYYNNFLGVRYSDKTGNTEVYIANMQRYVSHNGKGKSFFRYSQENPYLFEDDYERGSAPMNIEQYFYLMIWEQTNFRLVNLTDSYRGVYFKNDETKYTQDLLLNRDAGLIRINKYIKDTYDRMLPIMEQDKFYDELEFHGDKVMNKSKCKNLLIVSHMDDETIFFGNWLFLNGKDTKVISTCEPSTNPPKRESFQKVMEYCNVPEYEMWNWEESLNGYDDYDRLKNKVKDQVELNDFENVITHNAMGEYGHIQHQQLNEIITECLYEELIDNFWVWDLNPLALEYRGFNPNPKEDMINMYPDMERIHTVGIMRRCESWWYDHNKPGKFGSKFVGGGNLVDYEGMKLIQNTFDEKLNIGIIKEIPTLNKSYTGKFTGNITTALDESDKFDDVYSSFANDFSKTIFSMLEDRHNVEWVEVLDEFDDFVGLTNENKQMYIVVSIKSAMVLHKLGLPYVLFTQFTEEVPNKIKSSASRIVWSANHNDKTQFNETITKFQRHHHIVKYDINSQIWRAFVMKKRHNTIVKEDVFSWFKIDNDGDEETQGRLHMKLKNPDYEGYYFVEGLDIQSGNVKVNWKITLSTTNQIWIRAGITENISNEGFVLRFWKDPVKCEPGDGLHPEPHNHDYLPDWKTKKVRYPDFSVFVPRGDDGND